MICQIITWPHRDKQPFTLLFNTVIILYYTKPYFYFLSDLVLFLLVMPIRLWGKVCCSVAARRRVSRWAGLRENVHSYILLLATRPNIEPFGSKTDQKTQREAVLETNLHWLHTTAPPTGALNPRDGRLWSISWSKTLQRPTKARRTKSWNQIRGFLLIVQSYAEA